MIRRLIILQILLLAGLSSIWLLPKSPGIQEAALNLDPVKPDPNTILPRKGTLSGYESYEPVSTEGSVEEKARLAKDTEFFRRNYRRELSVSEQPLEDNAPLMVDELNASIVLSGRDLTGSIHALERCLAAQGYNIPSASTIHIKLRSGHLLSVRRLVCEKVEKDQVFRNIAYYWFVGHDSVTSNHIKRGLKDFYDRVVLGYDQRWAYITVTAQLNGGYLRQEPKDHKPLREGEELPRLQDSISGRYLARRTLTEEDADRIVNEFIEDLGPDVMKVDQIKEWPEE